MWSNFNLDFLNNTAVEVMILAESLRLCMN